MNIEFVSLQTEFEKEEKENLQKTKQLAQDTQDLKELMYDFAKLVKTQEPWLLQL